MYFVAIFMACLAFAQINVHNPSERGFEVQFDLDNLPGKGYWIVHDAAYNPLDKEIIYAVKSFCSGKIRGATQKFDVACTLEAGSEYELTLLLIQEDKGTRFSQKVIVPSRRRLLLSGGVLDTPTASPVTSAPTASPLTSAPSVTPTSANQPSQHPTRAPHTSAPTSPAGSLSPSQSPSGMPILMQTHSPTPAATNPVQITSQEPEQEEDSTFLGMDFGNSTDLSLFIIFLAIIIFVLFMVLFAPGLYRKYIASNDVGSKNGSKLKVAEVSKSEITSIISESVIDVVTGKKMTTIDSKVWRDPVE